MGFFSNLGSINKINVLLKQIEPKVEYIYHETQSYSPNLNKIKIECHAIGVLMSDIIDIADRSGNSVKLAPYYLFGRKMDLVQIFSVLIEVIEQCEQL